MRDFGHGYTLLEVLLTVLIFSVLLALAAPSMRELQGSVRRVGVERQLMSDLQRLRGDAGARGTRGVFTVLPGGESYAYGLDWLPFNRPAAVDGDGTLRTLPPGMAIEPEGTLIFDARGFLVDAEERPASASLTLSHDGYAFAVGTVLPTGALEFD